MEASVSELIHQIHRNLPLKDFGFAESTVSDYFVIYNSQQCRVKFVLGRERDDDRLGIYYGRLHAPDHTLTMSWQSHECHCWYSFSEIQDLLKFLNGLTPEEVYKTDPRYLREKWEPYGLFRDIMDITDEEDYLQAVLRIEASVWKHYGEKFFEVFDMRYPDVWNRYVQFLQDIHEVVNDVYRKPLGMDVRPKRYC